MNTLTMEPISVDRFSSECKCLIDLMKSGISGKTPLNLPTANIGYRAICIEYINCKDDLADEIFKITSEEFNRLSIKLQQREMYYEQG